MYTLTGVCVVSVWLGVCTCMILIDYVQNTRWLMQCWWEWFGRGGGGGGGGDGGVTGIQCNILLYCKCNSSTSSIPDDCDILLSHRLKPNAEA